MPGCRQTLPNLEAPCMLFNSEHHHSRMHTAKERRKKCEGSVSQYKAYGRAVRMRWRCSDNSEQAPAAPCLAVCCFFFFCSQSFEGPFLDKLLRCRFFSNPVALWYTANSNHVVPEVYEQKGLPPGIVPQYQTGRLHSFRPDVFVFLSFHSLFSFFFFRLKTVVDIDTSTYFP